MLIELLKPHTHAGRDYPAGSKLELSQADAEWLIALETAKPAPTTQHQDQTPTRKEK